MPIPSKPVLFIKLRTAFNRPAPACINVPCLAHDATSNYEVELSYIVAKSSCDILRERALEYMLGYTASNDVSAQAQQFKNSQ